VIKPPNNILVPVCNFDTVFFTTSYINLNQTQLFDVFIFLPVLDHLLYKTVVALAWCATAVDALFGGCP
jgi:hypothetical protein